MEHKSIASELNKVFVRWRTKLLRRTILTHRRFRSYHTYVYRCSRHTSAPNDALAFRSTQIPVLLLVAVYGVSCSSRRLKKAVSDRFSPTVPISGNQRRLHYVIDFQTDFGTVVSSDKLVGLDRGCYWRECMSELLIKLSTVNVGNVLQTL